MIFKIALSLLSGATINQLLGKNLSLFGIGEVLSFLSEPTPLTQIVCGRAGPIPHGVEEFSSILIIFNHPFVICGKVV